jgi:hypothetical protein
MVLKTDNKSVVFNVDVDVVGIKRIPVSSSRHPDNHACDCVEMLCQFCCVVFFVDSIVMLCGKSKQNLLYLFIVTIFIVKF